MKIEEDIKNIASVLLNRSADKEVVKMTIFASSDPNRHPLSPTYTFPESVKQMEKMNLIKIVDEQQLGKPIEENSTLINFYTNYQIQYSPIELAKFLKDKERIKLLQGDKYKIKIDEDPWCEEDEGIGYLKYYKEGPKIIIGRIDSEHYKFLSYMLRYFNAEIDIKLVYKYARNKEDKQQEKYEYEIEAIKKKMKEWVSELQKNGKMSSKKIGRIKFPIKKGKIKVEFIRFK